MRYCMGQILNERLKQSRRKVDIKSAGHKLPVVWGDRGRTPMVPAICSGVFGTLYTSISRNDDGDARDVINRTSRSEVPHRGSAVTPHIFFFWTLICYEPARIFTSQTRVLFQHADLWLNSISLILAHQSRWLLRSNLLSHRLLLHGWSNITRLYQMGRSHPVHTWWEGTRSNHMRTTLHVLQENWKLDIVLYSHQWGIMMTTSYRSHVNLTSVHLAEILKLQKSHY